MVFATLRSIAKIAPSGSSIIFDYMDADAFIPENASKRIQKMQQIVQNIGEPMKAGFDPSKLAADLAPLSLSVKKDLGPAEIEQHYFIGRTDDMHAFEHVHYAWVMVK